MRWAVRFAIAAFHLHAFFPTCLCLPPPPPPGFKTPAWEGPALLSLFQPHPPQKASNCRPTLGGLPDSNVLLFKALKKLTLAATDLLLARCLTAATLSHDTLPLPTAAVSLPEGGRGGARRPYLLQRPGAAERRDKNKK